MLETSIFVVVRVFVQSSEKSEAVLAERFHSCHLPTACENVEAVPYPKFPDGREISYILERRFGSTAQALEATADEFGPGWKFLPPLNELDGFDDFGASAVWNPGSEATRLLGERVLLASLEISPSRPAKKD